MFQLLSNWCQWIAASSSETSSTSTYTNEVDDMGINKPVPVCAYTRFRLGRLEYVCAHFRSYPTH